jgi:hypothetical protein
MCIEIFYEAVALAAAERTVGKAVTIDLLFVLLVLFGRTGKSLFNCIIVGIPQVCY